MAEDVKPSGGVVGAQKGRATLARPARRAGSRRHHLAHGADSTMTAVRPERVARAPRARRSAQRARAAVPQPGAVLARLERARAPRGEGRRAIRLLERVKFLAIFASNMDEFFQVRVAGLRQQVAASAVRSSPDGRTPAGAAGRDPATGPGAGRGAGRAVRPDPRAAGRSRRPDRRLRRPCPSITPGCASGSSTRSSRS